MAVTKDTFPFAPLGERDMKIITATFGIRSPDDSPIMDGFRHFLGVHRNLALPEEWYRHFLSLRSRQCLGALGMMDTRDTLASNRGALLYAGAASHVGGFRPLPRDGRVLSEKRDLREVDLAMSAYQAVDGIPSFPELLESVRPLLGGDLGFDGLPAARIGAGLLHLITTESVLVAERDGLPLSVPGVTPTVASGITMDEGFRDLIELFRDTDWPQQPE